MGSQDGSSPKSPLFSQDRIRRFSSGSWEEIGDTISLETRLRLEINGVIRVDVNLSPERMEEFVRGYLLSEGIALNFGDIQSVDIGSEDYGYFCRAVVRGLEARSLGQCRSYSIIWTECGSPGTLQRRLEGLTPMDPPPIINPRSILPMPKIAREHAPGFSSTGSLHGAFLFDMEGRYLSHAEDIGRHSAVDKVIGSAVMKGIALKKTVLFSTGRISTDIVSKCVRVGLPILVSRSAPLNNSVDLARRFGLEVIGFLRGERFNLYTAGDCFSGGSDGGK